MDTSHHWARAALLGACALVIPALGSVAQAQATAPRRFGLRQRLNHASPPITAGAGNVVYFGGHVISHVQIVSVMWGPNVAPEVVNGVGAFYAAITNSSYFDWMGEYDTVAKPTQDGQPGSNQRIYRGSLLKTVTITPANQNTTILDSDIQTELQAQIGSGVLPQPQVDPEGGVNTLYMIHFPPGVSIDNGLGSISCSQTWCAYHSSMRMPNVGSGVPYGILPDYSQGGCTQGCGSGGGTVLDTMTQVASHELGEAVTDTEIDNPNQTGRPLAWDDSANGEIGDICENVANAWVQLAGFSVQQLWSQRLGSCVAEDPTLTVCDGTVRPCRPCAAVDCSGAKPTCDTDPSSPKVGQCVGGCSSNAQCPMADKPVCDTSSGTCRGCQGDADCSGATPKCSTSTGACVVCLTNRDCATEAAPVCDATSYVCRGCSTKADCPASETCNASTGACGASVGPTGDAGSGGGVFGGAGDGGGATQGGSNGAANGGGSSGCTMIPSGAPEGATGLSGLALGLAAIVRRRRSRR